MICGIDTVQLFLDKDILEYLDLNNFEYVKKGSKAIASSGCRLIIRPHRENTLATIQETTNKIIEIEITYGCKAEINRIDLAFNSNIDLSKDRDRAYANYLMESIALKKDLNVFRTTRSNQIGNIKVSSRYKEQTFYKCDDKDNRQALSRCEFRFKGLTVTNFKQIFLDKAEEVINLLYSVDDLNKELDEKLSSETLEIFKKELENNEIVDFTNFLIKHRGKVLSRNQFNLMVHELDSSIRPDKFIKKWEKVTRGEKIYFIIKSEYKKMISTMIKQLIEFKNS